MIGFGFMDNMVRNPKPRTPSFRGSDSGFGVQGLGFRVQGSGFGVWVLGFRVQGVELGVQGVGCRA